MTKKKNRSKTEKMVKRENQRTKKYNSDQYLRDFESMEPEKQERHLLFIINWVVSIIKGRSPI